MAMAHEDMLLRIVARQHRTYDTHGSGGLDGVTDQVMGSLIERGLIKPHTRYGSMSYEATDTGKAHLDLIDTRTLREGIGTGGRQVSPGDRMLMVWLLEHGGVVTYYGGGTLPDSRIWHVAACGLDWDKSSSPEHDSWETFAGTFAEGDDRHSGLSASITCQCGEVERQSVQAESDSLVDLIRDLIT